METRIAGARIPPFTARFVFQDVTPRGRLVAGLIGAALVVLWHLLLPAPFYQRFPFATWLEGPLPALLGAGIALWRRRAGPLWLHALAVCAHAVAGMLVAVLLLGPLFLGLTASFKGVAALLVLLPGRAFVALVAAPIWQSMAALWPLWMGIKTLLLWGAIGYGAALFLRRDGAAALRAWWAERGEQRAFSRAQRQLMQDYRKRYLAALQAGEPAPPAPAGLMAGTPGSAWGDRAKATFWLLRIGFFLVGAVWLWSAFDEYLIGLARQLVGPLLLGRLLGG